jgi:hypothetical protein
MLQVAEEKSYQEAFDSFDWNKNGTIPVKVKSVLLVDVS